MECPGPWSFCQSSGPYPHLHQLNPSASAFYPVVSGPPVPCCRSGCSDSSLGLPRFGASPNVDGPATQVGQVGGNCSVAPQFENALPGCGPWVHVCGCLCGVCGLCVCCSELATRPIFVHFTRSRKVKDWD